MVPTSELRRKVSWLMAGRALISTVLLGSATVIQITAPGSFQVDPFFFLIGLTCALTVVYSVLLRFVDRHRWLIDAQLAGDALIVSAFIYVTGGVASYFSTLYALPIVAGSVMLRRRGGLLVATFSALLYGGLILAQYLTGLGLLHYSWLEPSVALPARSFAGYTYALNAFGFFAVAWLSGSLAEGLQTAGARLALASSQIADLQALNQHVIDSMPSGLVTTDPALRIVTFNQAAEAITDLSFRTVVGCQLVDVLQVPPELMQLLSADLENRSRSRRIDYQFSGGRSGRIEIGLSAAHLVTPGGRAGYLFVFQDVTDIRKLERAARLQQRLAAVGEMAAGIAHEIRNPLASISGSIQILRQELPVSAEQGQLMDIVLRESERLNTTIRSFLDYARPQRFAISRFDARRVLNDTALLLRNSAEIRDDHVIDVDIPPTELWCEADEGQIKQIVWNLATNGVRAMPHGGRLRLIGHPASSGEGIVLTVSDEGVGIPPEEMDALFQPFHGSSGKGAGLGLAIVHRIVSDYSGELQVSSELGKGTTMSVRLPGRVVVSA